MLSCKQMTDKLSAEVDGELSVFDRLSVRFHQFICEDCKQAAANMRALVTSMKNRPPSAVDSDLADAPDEDYVNRVMAALEAEKDKK